MDKQTEEALKIQQLNIMQCQEAMGLLYQTFIEDRGNAELRGMAITAIERMILNMGGEDTMKHFESIPFSKRMRESGDPELVKIAKNIAEKSFNNLPAIEDDDDEQTD